MAPGEIFLTSDSSHSPVATGSAGENNGEQELGERVFEVKLSGLFFTWNLRLAKVIQNYRKATFAHPWHPIHFQDQMPPSDRKLDLKSHTLLC